MGWCVFAIVFVGVCAGMIAAYLRPSRRARRWAVGRGMAAGGAVAEVVGNTVVAVSVRWALGAGDVVLLRVSCPPMAGRALSRRGVRGAREFTLLAVRRAEVGLGGEVVALRPTGRLASVVDLWTLGQAKSGPLLSFPSVSVGGDWVPFATEHADPALFGLLPGVPGDVGVVLGRGWMILDLPPWRLTARYLDEVCSGVPLIRPGSPPMISPR